MRLTRGWSQEEMPDIIGSHRSYAGALERGEKNVRL